MDARCDFADAGSHPSLLPEICDIFSALADNYTSLLCCYKGTKGEDVVGGGRRWGAGCCGRCFSKWGWPLGKERAHLCLDGLGVLQTWCGTMRRREGRMAAGAVDKVADSNKRPLRKRASVAFPATDSTATHISRGGKERRKLASRHKSTSPAESHSYMHGLICTEHNVVCSLTHKHGRPPRIHTPPVSQRKVMRPRPLFGAASALQSATHNELAVLIQCPNSAPRTLRSWNACALIFLFSSRRSTTSL